MKKSSFYSKALLFLLSFSISCANTDSNNNENKSENNSTVSSQVKPASTNQEISDDIRKKVDEYVKTNDVFSKIPYQQPEKYDTDLSGDGVPIFLTGDGVPIFLTGDGVPIFGIKNEDSQKRYLWNRTPKDLIFDYLQVTNITNESWGHTTYAHYSQILNYDISVSQPLVKNKNAELVKLMSFGLTEDEGKLKLHSVSAINIRPKNIGEAPYDIRTVMFTTEKTKFLFSSGFRLTTLPGISLSKEVGSNKFNLFVEVIFNARKPLGDNDFAVIASIKGKQYPLYKVSGNIYGNSVEFPELEEGKTEGLAFEAIDRKSLAEDGEYYGYTYIMPVTR